MENKVQQIEILGHTVNYTSDTNSLIDPDTIEEAIEFGDKEGTLYKAYDLTFTPIGKWWITDWKEIATKFAERMKNYGGYCDDIIKMYEDAAGE